jgi:predicted FMN-binding regulatory protein PaiB
MYRPPAFREDRLDVLHALIEAHRLGTLVTHGDSGLVANRVEIPIERLEGKWKASQNQPEGNRVGVAEGLAAVGKDAMAELVARR